MQTSLSRRGCAHVKAMQSLHYFNEWRLHSAEGGSLGSQGEEVMPEEFVAAFCHLEGLHVLLGLWDALLALVSFGEHEREGHLRICQPACALDVSLLNAHSSVGIHGLSMPVWPPSEHVLCV